MKQLALPPLIFSVLLACSPSKDSHPPHELSPESPKIEAKPHSTKSTDSSETGQLPDPPDSLKLTNPLESKESFESSQSVKSDELPVELRGLSLQFVGEPFFIYRAVRKIFSQSESNRPMRWILLIDGNPSMSLSWEMVYQNMEIIMGSLHDSHQISMVTFYRDKWGDHIETLSDFSSSIDWVLYHLQDFSFYNASRAPLQNTAALETFFQFESQNLHLILVSNNPELVDALLENKEDLTAINRFYILTH